ncbi:SPOR domain-containing protein [Helicobacter mehlei]|uniref:SPOR domain-containing protein n=1 Tax=Helicobacter mehlei TaxID=2316080 RepID=A0A553V2I2_9HELI|nr:hypothetical protein [Helicobacter mehlei]TSA86640.1 hypothetical protein FNE76_01560 [Helicobacter mehlei]
MDNNSELNQELNKKLSEALAEESRGSGVKKILLIAAIALIVLAVVLVVFWKTSREPTKSVATPPADQSLQKVGNIHDNNFENLTLEPSANKKQEDKFDKIVQDIQARQAKTEGVEESSKLLALPTSPLDKKTEQSPVKSELHPQPLEQKPMQAEKPKSLPPQHTQEKRAEKHAEKHAQKHATKPQKHAENKHVDKKTPHEVKKQPEKSAQKHPEKKPHKAPEPHKAQVAHATPPSKQVSQEHPVSKPKELPKSVAKAPTPTPQNPAPKAPPAPAAIPKGIYLQVGVFSKAPNPHFLETIKQYPHQVQEINGQKRYLIGPYANREQADAQIAPITEHIGKPVHVEIK